MVAQLEISHLSKPGACYRDDTKRSPHDRNKARPKKIRGLVEVKSGDLQDGEDTAHNQSC
jgi:hypothetical protein